MKNTWGDLLLTDYKHMETKSLSIIQCVGISVGFLFLVSIALIIFIFCVQVYVYILGTEEYAMMVCFLIFSLMLYFIARFMLNRYLISNIKLKKKKLSLKHYFWVVLIELGGYLVLTATLYRGIYYLPDIGPKIVDYNYKATEYKLFSVLTSVLLFPIVEEIVFRRIIQRGLTKKYTMKTALVASTLIFAVCHFSLQQSIAVIPSGILLGYIYMKTSSLKLCIVIHGFHNLICEIAEDFVHIKPNNIEYLGVFILGVLIMGTALKYFIATTEASSKPLECNIE